MIDFRTHMSGAQVNDVFIMEEVISQWDFTPKEAFVFYTRVQDTILEYLLKEYTYSGEKTFKTRILMKEDVNEKLKEFLKTRYPDIVLKGEK